MIIGTIAGYLLFILAGALAGYYSGHILSYGIYYYKKFTRKFK